MRFELNAVFIAESLNLVAAREVIAEIDERDLLLPLRQDPLRLPWDMATSPRSPLGRSDGPAPWAEDERILAVADSVVEALASGDSAVAALADVCSDDRAAYVASVRTAALSWVDNIVRLASGEDQTFEHRYSNRTPVLPSGSIIFCPEDFEASDPTDANVFGEILLAARDVFPEIASALGVHPLGMCDISVTPKAAVRDGL